MKNISKALDDHEGVIEHFEINMFILYANTTEFVTLEINF